MAQVRDPAFWKRFSTAVHLSDVEFSPSSTFSPSASSRPKLEHQDSWLGRQEKKKRRRTLICWAFWIGLLAFSTVVVIVVILLLRNGVFDKIGKSIDGLGKGDSS